MPNSKPIGASLSNKELLNKYPMRRSGGLFLILIGITLLFSFWFSHEYIINHKVFMLGMIISIFSFTTIKYFSQGRPSKYQVIALGLALLLEFILAILLVNIMPPETTERSIWLYGSIIVGIHFLPMAYCFGTIMLFLGIGCIINAVTGLLLTQFPYEVFGIIDGILKLGVGIIMFRVIEKSLEIDF